MHNQKNDLNFLVLQKTTNRKNTETLLDKFLKNKLKFFFLFFLFILILVFYFFFLTKINLEQIKINNFNFEIDNGQTVGQVAANLKNKNIIKSQIVFKMAMILIGKSDLAIAGIYKLEDFDNILSLAKKINSGNFLIPPIKIIIPEGSTNLEISNIIFETFQIYQNQYFNIPNLQQFSSSTILEKLNNKEGFLFPDSYLFLPNISLEQVVEILENNFQKKLKNIFDNFNNIDQVKILTVDLKKLDLENLDLNKKVTILNNLGTTTVSIKNIIKMASYLEGEANNETDMRIVAGILWQRLKMGMYLQIDVATSSYKYKGFTNNPINNPGQISILASLNPIKTGYIYYLTDNDGVMRYSKDYPTHIKNIKKYLRNRN